MGFLFPLQLPEREQDIIYVRTFCSISRTLEELSSSQERGYKDIGQMEKEQRSPWRVPINLERYKDGYIEITSLQNQLLNAKLKQADVIHWKNHVRSLLVPLTKKQIHTIPIVYFLSLFAYSKLHAH